MKFVKKMMSGLWDWRLPASIAAKTDRKGPLLLYFHTFKTLLLGLVFVFEMDRSLPMVLSMGIWYFSCDMILRDVDAVQKFAWRLTGLVCILLRQPTGMIPFGLFVLNAETDRFPAAPEQFWWLVKWLYSNTRVVDEWVQVGNNDDVIGFFALQDLFVKDMIGAVKAYFKSSTMIPRIIPRYLRRNGIANNVKEIEDAFMPPDECVDLAGRAATQGRLLMTLGSAVFVLFVYSAPSVIFTLFIMCVYLKDQVAGLREPMMSTIGGLQDGVYRLEKLWFGIVVSRSIGVVHEGVMHAPYHGVSNCDLVTAGRTYEPQHIDLDRDFVTWGGRARFTKFRDGDEVIVNSEDDDGRASYRVPVMSSPDGSLSWPGKTEPGHSGSPVWALRGEKLDLLGLAGNWVSVSGERKSEYIRGGTVDSVDVPRRKTGEITRICRHPGFGKTRKIIAELVAQELAIRRARVFVLGPTRVVCRELYASLSSKFPRQVLLDISESPRENRDAKVIIMAHATYVARLLRESPSVMNPTAVIVDEAHVDDASTHCLRLISEGLCEQGTRVIHLSATFPDEIDEGSNYPIQDVEVKASEVVKLAVDGFLEENRKCLIFVPGLDGKDGANAIKRQIQRSTKDEVVRPQVVVLARKTFSVAMGHITAGKYDIIVSTNIAECGINLDVDDVYDFAEQFLYVEEDEDIVGKHQTITVASRVQRRGRVGRFREGRYLYVKAPDERHYKSSAEFDGEMLANAYLGGVRKGKYNLTRKQASKALEHGISPRTAALIYGLQGEKKKGSQLRADVSDWANSSAGRKKTSCAQNKSKCPCIGESEWFDDRDHDVLVKLLQNTTGILEKKSGEVV